MKKLPFKNIGNNLFAGFAVSMVALPLALGLALASGVPPVAGLVTAVIGGILTALLGGSNVTITGPGNGLVVVTLSAVSILGAGDALAGYALTLAAIVCSGVIILLFGLMRFGALGDLFPSAAVQGLLAAIGLIIMSKQLHVMLGVVNPEAGSTVELFATFPSSVQDITNGEIPWLVTSIGLGSLVLMFLLSASRNKYLRLIPPPLWVVLMAIGLSYLSLSSSLLEPIQPDYLISIPDKVVSELGFPDFSKITEGSFWSVVLSLTFIASLESLLSIKAVDKLDPQKRRSDVNKDLRALGMATIVSGFSGGLNVVSVIARSSVNVNNGATNRLSNMFHGLFLLLFVLAFTRPLQKIPLPALAAILVYTGYRLASPSVFRSIAKVGWQQLTIFIITLLTTLFTNLITGIFTGILATLLFQLRILKKADVLLRYVFKPNTLLYQENDEQYHLSVKAFSSFLNYLGLKKKLDSIPPSCKVIVDFSLAEFVDYSVLEHLQNYSYSFKSKGGDLEIIGLDNLDTDTDHPLAPRIKGKGVKGYTRAGKTSSGLTQRQKSLRLFSKKLGWEFIPDYFYNLSKFNGFKYFSIRIIDSGHNRIMGTIGSIKVHMADINYHEGELNARNDLQSTMIVLSIPERIPGFVLEEESLLDKVSNLAGFTDINFSMHIDFSNRFRLKGNDEKRIRAFFDDKLLTFFEENKAYRVESNGLSLLIYDKERLNTISEIKQLVSFANRLGQLLDSRLQK